MMPVRVRGIFDHSKEIMVNKVRKGEKGADVVTPFYTHLDKNKRPCAILVNRGWVPYDLLHQRMHQKQSTGVLYGILYPGDAKNKWSLPNSPTIEDFNIVTPADFALID
jgi:cytochrome oxidase assembly protein ShyY1